MRSEHRDGGKLYIMTESKNTGEDALAKIGMTIEELQEARAKLDASRDSAGRTRDGRICACGHRMSAHVNVAGAAYCRPTKHECSCKRARPVLEVQDVRCFAYKTEGSGGLHALSQGILASIERGKSVKWTVDLKCDRCSNEVDRLIPTCVSQRGQAVAGPTGYDALLCEDCRRDV